MHMTGCNHPPVCQPVAVMFISSALKRMLLRSLQVLLRRNLKKKVGISQEII